jgi:uncharacterized protein (TIGR03000 family)
MRKSNCRWTMHLRMVVALALAAALATSVGAYINGGVHHSTLKIHEKRLRRIGWAVSVGEALPLQLTDQSELERSVNQLIGQALLTFGSADMDKVSLETKREIARIAREAIEKGIKDKQTNLETGILGSLRYQVGVVGYSSYWENEEFGRTRIRGRSFGYAPVIALMPRRMVQLVEARISIAVAPEAEIFFDGEATTQKGDLRHYDTPALEVGKTYSYEIRARLRKDGKMLERSRNVAMTGGDAIQIHFDFTEPRR